MAPPKVPPVYDTGPSLGAQGSPSVGDVEIGAGALAGRGVYAARRFAAGEVVVSYELRRLTRAEYLELPEGERLFVHSYWGERFLYPPPARYVNHADSPNTYQDFDQGCDIALRDIEPGELITIDAREETDRELATFLLSYERAVRARDRRTLESLVAESAIVWVGARRGERGALIDALLHEPDDLCIQNPHWIIATGRWEAVCSYDLDEPRRHVTDVLRVVDGSWQILYRHQSAS
jgi:hypothetical protein